MNLPRSIVATLAVAAAILVRPSPAWSQADSPPLAAGWQDGFFVQSANADYRLQLGLLLQFDQRWAFDDPQHAITNTFTLRRIRPILQGRVARYFDFYFNPDFAGAIVNIRDAYVDTRFSNAFRVRVGKAKAPFGLERLQGAAFLAFVERDLPTDVAPDRDVGVQVLGDLSGGVFSYQAGVFNGVVDGGSSEGDTNDGKDLVARVVVRPFLKKASGPLAGLGLALAGSSGPQPTALPLFPSSGRQIFFAYDPAAVGEGVRTRYSPQYFYYYKAFGSWGEYVHSEGTVTKGAVSDDIAHQSLMIAGSIVVTGEAASDHGVRPKNPFDPAHHAWGALQLTGRYHRLTVDPKAVSLGFAAAGASREARAFTIGANWYLNPIIKWVFDVERTVFDGNPTGPRHAENVFLMRNQIGF
jgi:phosphate-selective porin OprO/OprP